MRAFVGLLVLAAAPGFSADAGPAVPLFFFPNTGLTDPSIRFIAETPQLRAGFRTDSAVFQVPGGSLTVRFARADPDVTIEGSETMPGKVNFMIGSDARSWKTGVPTYRAIVYRGLYPGIDLSYAGSEHRIKSEFNVAPGADPAQIRIEYPGADSVAIDAGGDLVIDAAGIQLREKAPQIYQESSHGRVHIEGRYRLAGPHTVGFEIDSFDASQPLVIDPVISYCTFLGGSALGAVTGLAADIAGNLYVVGWTEAIDFPIVGAIQAANKGGVDAFIAKLNAAGTALVYSTYIGGRGDDRAAGIAVDFMGQAYVAGSTSSTNFPLVAPIRLSLGSAGRNAFALKVNAAGSALVYSTYLGGSTYDVGTAVAVDGSGNAYIAGDTQSADFPVLNAAQNKLGGATDSFVMKLTPAGALSFSTFLGGAAVEHTGGVAVDSSGVYVTGGTFSTNFPVVGAIQSVNRGAQDAFVTKISASGSSFVYSTYLGGNGGALGTPEQGNGIAVDTGGNAYIAGVTNSTNFPVTSGVFQPSFDGVQDAFVSKINAAGNALVYSTYLGGASMDWASGIAVDTSGNATVAGYTSSFDFPTVSGVQGGFNGLYDAFVSTLNATGAQLSFSTYYGGAGSDSANAIALDSNRNIYTGGQTNSSDLRLQSPIQSANLGGSIGWLLRLGVTGVQLQAVSVTPASGTGSTQTFTLIYSDSSGATDISSAQVLFNTSVAFTNACWVQVDPVHAAAYLANDGNTQLMGPITLGTSATLQNSQCTLKGTGSSASLSGNRATVILAMTFQPAFAGAKNTYGSAQNALGLNSGWQTLGTWTVSAGPPQVLSVTPSSGSGGSQTFSFVYSDPNGASDLASTQALFNTAVAFTNACWIQVDPVHRTAYLENDGDTQLLGPITLGTSATLQNSQCVLNGTGSSVTLSGNTGTVNLAVAFLAAFVGAKNSYGLAQSAAGLNSGWQTLGSWTVPAAGPPQVVSITPPSGSGSSQTFSLIYSDPSGATDISSAQVLFNTTVTFTNACWIQVDPVHGTAYLENDGNTQLLGPITLGTLTTLQNSQCILNATGSSLTLSGNTATVNLAVTFQPAFAGTKNSYGFAQNAAGLNSGWQTLGMWTVPAPGSPQAVSVTPSSGSGGIQTFTFVYSDPNGASDLASAQALFNTVVAFTNACWIQVDPVHGTAYLANDGNTQLLGPITIGMPGTLQNSQCILNGTGSNVTLSGNLATVNLAVTFLAAFTGAKNSYGFAQSLGGLNSGWSTLGTWVVPASGPPQVVSVTPSSGTGISQTFSFVYSDPSGASDLTSTQALFNATLGSSNACWLWVDPVHAAAYLANDAGTQFVGPITLGTSATLQNSQCILKGNGSTVTLSGNTATVNLAVTFLPAFFGAKNTYGFAQSSGGLSGWQPIGTWTAGQLEAVSVTPSSGSGSSQTFSFVYSDPNGGSDITSAQALFSTVVSPSHSCYVLVDPVHSLAYLANDTFTGYLGPITLASFGTVQNSQCIVNGTGSSVLISGTLATVNLAVTFQSAYAGTKNIYGLAQTAAGLNSGWQTLGTWTATVTLLQAVSVTPASGSGSSQTFTFLYTDPNGGSDITVAQALFSTVVSPSHSCYVLVDPVHATAYLANDAFTGYLGPITLGTSATLQNSQCFINGAGSSASTSGNAATVSLAVTFQPAYAGSKNVYGLAQTAAGLNSGWQTLGTWTVTPTLLQAVSVTPSSGIGGTQTFTFVYSDPNGGSDIKSAQILFNTAIVPTNTCYVLVDPGTHAAYLANDGFTGYLGPITLGAPGTMQNSQCIINGTGSSASTSGANATVNLAVTFQGAFTGLKNIYGLAQSTSGANSGWLKLGTWTPR